MIAALLWSEKERLVAIIYMFIYLPLTSSAVWYLKTAADNCKGASNKRFTTFNCQTADTFAISYCFPWLVLFAEFVILGIAFLCGRLIK